MWHLSIKGISVLLRRKSGSKIIDKRFYYLILKSLFQICGTTFVAGSLLVYYFDI